MKKYRVVRKLVVKDGINIHRYDIFEMRNEPVLFFHKKWVKIKNEITYAGYRCWIASISSTDCNLELVFNQKAMDKYKIVRRDSKDLPRYYVSVEIDKKILCFHKKNWHEYLLGINKVQYRDWLINISWNCRVELRVG